MILILFIVVFLIVLCNVIYLGKLNKNGDGLNLFPNLNRGLIMLFIIISYFTYFSETINGITLICLMISAVIVLIIWSIFIFNKHNTYYIKNTHLFLILIILFLIIIDLKLPIYDKYVVVNYVNRETIETGENANIYMLVVGEEVTPKGETIDSDIKILSTDKVNNITRYFSLCKTCLTYKLDFIFNDTPLDKSVTNAESYLGQETSGTKYLKSSKKFSGDSAGLALVIGGLIEKGEIQNKQSIAITGAIDNKGNVLPIGRVEEKVQIAYLNKHDYVIVPIENYDDALKKANDLNLSLKIYSVGTIEEAIMVIQELNFPTL